MSTTESGGIEKFIRDNLTRLNQRIACACERSCRHVSEITLVAVAKNFPGSVVRAAYNCGINNFGENRVQEAKNKYTELNDLRPNIKLHMVGHIQTNKVKEVINIFDIIHSIDSIRLARALNDRAGTKLNIMLEVNVSGEKTKFGFSPEELVYAIDEIGKMPMLKLLGLMTVAPIVNDIELIRPIFRKLRFLKESFGLKELSMGMTDDFEVAIEEGATMIRIGRAIFGERSVE